MSVSSTEFSSGDAESTARSHVPLGRVLLAEDSATLRRLVGHVLAKECGELVLASDGREAVEKVFAAEAEDRSFELVLMDVMMPRLDGCEATAELRRRGYKGRVIILTAADEEYDLARSLSAGADDFLAKPFTPSDLQNMVRGHAG